MNLSDLSQGDCFRVAGANVGMEVLSIVDRGRVSRIRVRNIGDDADAVRAIIGRDTIHNYVWANDTPVYPVPHGETT